MSEVERLLNLLKIVHKGHLKECPALTPLTPKQVARAIGVSESSLKRWCDRGVIATVRTAGGHRRIDVAALLAFLRESGHQVVQPEVLGLPAVIGSGQRTWERSRARLVEALIAGDEALARQVVFDLFVSGQSVANLADQLFHPAMKEIGERWDCGAAEVYQERRACEICSRVLFELRGAIAQPAPDAPLAIGGTPSGDPYRLPTAIVELVLREAGWRSVSLGSSLPFETLAAAVVNHQPRLLWLSVSYLQDAATFIEGYQRFYESLAPRPAIALGGAALTEAIRKELTYAAYCDNMRQLVSFVESLGGAHTPSSTLRLHDQGDVA